MHKKISLKTRILFPVALILAILLFAFNFSLYQHEQVDAGHRFQEDLNAVKSFYQSALLRRSEKLGAALEAIRRDEHLQAALRSKDRDMLLKRTAPLFKELQKQYGITHFYFEDDSRVNVLRVHQPGYHGDTINRHTTLTAEKTGKTAIGVELGVLGTFTLRAVAPMRDSAGLIGYVELGQEIEDVLIGINDITGTDVLLTIDKPFLVRKDWEDGMRMLGLKADWDQFPGVVLTHQSSNLSQGLINRVLSLKSSSGYPMELKDSNRHYYRDDIPIEEASGGKVGKLIVLRDMTPYSNELQETVLYLTMVYVPLAAILFAFLYLITRRVERRLDESQQQIIDQGHEREAIQAQHIAELKEERDKLHQAKEVLQKNEQDLRLAATVFENSTEGIMITDTHSRILRVNRAFTEITGYSEEEAIGETPQMLRSDRHDAIFYQEMWASLIEYGYWQGEVWNRRKNGEAFPEWLTLIAIREESRKILYYLGVFADLTEKKTSEARTHHLSNYDVLTELPNRHLLEERLKQALTEAHHHGWMVAVEHLNLDRFKTIIDTLGHTFGDKLLRAVAERLAGHIRDSDTLARFSGDEFAVVLSDVGSQHNASLVAQKIINAMAEPFILEGHEIYLTVSIGIALYPVDAGNKDDLVKNANVAARHTRDEGGNSYHFYTSEMNATASQRLTLESSLRRALERNEFVLYYQPQVNLASGRIVGMEALIRWQHPGRGLIYPQEFISLLEETGLIVPVGEWVLRTACAQNVALQAAGLPPLRVAVNLSARQFRQNDLVAAVRGVLQETGLAPQQLELEITESILLQDVQATLTILNQLHNLGIEISIDDFGTGYSSLTYLKRLPISKIKIDQSFIQDIGTSHDDGAIANAVISLGHSLKMQVIAEGVETSVQLDHLRTQGCDEIQGYYFSRPLPADAFAQLVKKKLASL